MPKIFRPIRSRELKHLERVASSLPFLVSTNHVFGFISTYSIPQTVTALQCQLIQETVLNTLLGDQPDYVASFGNSDVNRVGDWVKILNTKPANEVGQK